jgi:hypothetical protein
MYLRMMLPAFMATMLVTAGAQAQNYTLTIKEHTAPGKNVVVKEVGTTRSSGVVTQGGKILQELKSDEVSDIQYTERVVEAGTPRPKKITRTYAKAQKGDKGKAAALFYQGKTVVLELKGDKYQATLQGVEVKEAKMLLDLAALAATADKSNETKALLPHKAVGVGDAWQLGKDAVLVFMRDMPDGADLANLKAQGRLLKTYKKDAQQWGTLEFNVAMPLKKLGGAALPKPVFLQIKMTIDTAIDGSSTAGVMLGTMTLRGSADITSGNQTYLYELDYTSEFRIDRSAEQ